MFLTLLDGGPPDGGEVDVASAGRLALWVTGTALQSSSSLDLAFEDGTPLMTLVSPDGGPVAPGGSYVFTWVVESQDNLHTKLIANAGVIASLGLNVHVPDGGTVLWDRAYACAVGTGSCNGTDTELASVAVDADAGLLYAIGRADLTTTDICDGGLDREPYLLAASTADGGLLGDVIEGSGTVKHPGGEGTDLSIEQNYIFQVGFERDNCKAVGYIEYRQFQGSGFNGAQLSSVYGDGGSGNFYFDQLAVDSDGTLLVSGHTPDAPSPKMLLVGYQPSGLNRTRDVNYAPPSINFGYPLAVDTTDESVWQGWLESGVGWDISQVYPDGGLSLPVNPASTGKVLGLAVADGGQVYGCGFVTGDGGDLASGLWSHSQQDTFIRENPSALDDACLGLAIDPRGNVVTVDRENRGLQAGNFGATYTFRVRSYDASWNPRWMSAGAPAAQSHYDGANSPSSSEYEGHHMAIDADGFIYAIYNQGGRGHIVKISP